MNFASEVCGICNGISVENFALSKESIFAAILGYSSELLGLNWNYSFCVIFLNLLNKSGIYWYKSIDPVILYRFQTILQLFE